LESNDAVEIESAEQAADHRLTKSKLRVMAFQSRRTVAKSNEILLEAPHSLAAS
jgi:hypothetical protein